jgi:hypothetical protein
VRARQHRSQLATSARHVGDYDPDSKRDASLRQSYSTRISDEISPSMLAKDGAETVFKSTQRQSAVFGQHQESASGLEVAASVQT